jgi:hypothetical protein
MISALHTSNLAIVGAFTCLLVTTGYTPASAAMEGQTPLKGMDSQAMNYPSGTNLRAEYESFEGGIRLQAAERGRMSRAAASSGAAALLQSRLPEGLTLHKGAAARVMADPRGVRTMEMESGEGTGKVFVTYPVDYQGIPLARGNDAFAIISEEGDLQTVRFRNLPSQVDATNPTVDREAAGQMGKQHAQSGSPGGTLTMTEPTLEIWVEPGSPSGRLAWTYTVSSSSTAEPFGRQYWVTATGEPTILHWESTIFHTHHGTVTGKVWLTSPLQPTGNHPLSELGVVRTGGGGGSTTTGPTGAYQFPSGTGTATIKSSLDLGSVSKIENQAGAVMARSKSDSHTTPIDLDFNAAGELELAQTSGFYWTNVAFNFHKSILTPLPTTPYKNLPTRVNINQQCNAFWNGSSINFYKEGTNCVNSAYSSVVLHEYGHGVDHWRGGIVDGGYSEGYGDAVAILVTRSACLGLDFLKDGKCLRDATEVVKWPPANSEVHFVGKIYAGFTWELIQQLKGSGLSEDEAYKIASQVILAAAAGNPSNIPDAVNLSFLADDDDGNLGNSTPHCLQIKAAADSRTIPLPAGLNCATPPPPPPGKACSAVGSNGQFSLTENKKVSSNSNIVKTMIHLDQEMEVHINANTSVKTSDQSREFRTGFYNQETPNTMWTFSYRPVRVPQANQWVNFGSTFAIRLQPGDHSFYWKIWVTGGDLEFSSGSMSVEAFCIPGQSASRLASRITTFRDASGQDVIQVEEVPQPGLLDTNITTFRDNAGQEVIRIVE